MNNHENMVISLLRKALHKEMESVHQYFIYHRVMEYKGYNKLAKLFKMFSIDEMRHADKLMGRILFLGGDISVHFSKPIYASHDLVQIFTQGMEDEREAIQLYNQIAAEAEHNGDYETSSLTTAILHDEERHFDVQRQQYDIIGVVGETAYITEQIDVLGEQDD